MIHIVIGTRAQFFKMAPVMRECQARSLEWRWIYTAQHKETIAQSQKTFGLPDPDYTVVRWQTEAKTMGKLWYWFAKMIFALFRGKRILAGHTGKQNIVVTHGDTITTWWAALLGRLYRCKVMHVEAGLRSWNLFSPFPEEINRIITSKLANYYICPGKQSVKNLRKYKGNKINTILNTQADTIAFGLKNSQEAKINLPKQKYAVVSLHRYENIFKKERFEKIITLLAEISKKFRLQFVLHPATETQLNKLGLRDRLEKNHKIDLLPRLEYLPFIKLINASEFVITDGGGNQEELYFMGKPTLLFRDETERPEELGKTAVLSKLDAKIISNFLNNYKKFRRPRIIVKKSPSSMIVDVLEKFSN